MLQKYTKYDYRVQIMRILACFIVICCHVRIEPMVNGVLDITYLLLYVLFDDGVTIFFMIMGFFLFTTKEPFWKNIGKTFIRILVPIFFTKLAIQLFDSWIINDISFFECIAHPSINLKGIIKSFLALNFTEGNYSSHLWYINSYLHIIVAVPLLKLLTLDIPLSKKACKWVIFISIINMTVTDFQCLYPRNTIEFGTFRIFGNLPIVFVLIGYVIYKNQNIIKNKKNYRFLFLAGMAGISVLRFSIDYVFRGFGLDNNYHNYWNTIFSLIFSLCFIGFFLSFSPDANCLGFRIANYIGTKTYIIYLIHVAVYTFGDYHNIRNWLYSITIQVTSNPIAKLGYDIIYPIMIFICCLMITVCLDCIKVPIYFIHSLFKRNKNTA